MLLDKREELLPMDYPQFYDYLIQHWQTFWTHQQISFTQDVVDFNTKLTPAQKQVIGNTLKLFTQLEMVVGQCYWSGRVAKWFPIPEIQMMATEFSARESIHAVAYSQVDVNLGLTDYTAFLREPAVAAKMDKLMAQPVKTLEDKALNLAIFSAFTEGVNLFSSFAVLWSFANHNLMKGLGKVINYSQKDEGIHSSAGCELFRLMATEYDLYSAEMKKRIYDAARWTVALEDDFLDKSFELGDIPGLTKHQVKQWIRMRANQKLIELGLKTNWKNIDVLAAEELDAWFSQNTIGESDADFFQGRVTGAYSKGNKDWGKIFDANGMIYEKE